MNKVMLSITIVVLIIVYVVLSSAVIVVDGRKISSLEHELAICKNEKRPQGVIIRTGNGESTIIAKDGSFKLSSNSEAHIEYIYQDHVVTIPPNITIYKEK